MDELLISLYQLPEYLNSPFIASLLSALFGALFGALAAQKIATRYHEKEYYQAQINATNLSIMNAYSIANSALSMKHQHLERIYKNLISHQLLHEKHIKNVREGKASSAEQLELTLDFQIILMRKFPTERIEKIVFENIPASSRILASINTISGLVNDLSTCLERRTSIIDRFKRATEAERKQVHYYYLGLENENGNIDTEYPDCIRGAHQYTNDIIFFSKLLCEDLEKYGHSIMHKYEKKFGSTEQKILSTDFKIAEEKDLLPNKDDYADWLQGFPEET